MTDGEDHIQHLQLAELQFRLASAVRLATAFETQPLDLPIEWSDGKDRVRLDEIALAAEDAECAAAWLHLSATFFMAAAMENAIRAAVHDPEAAADAEIRSAYQISRLIRKAFARSPFAPVWSIDPDCRDRVFAVRDAITLDTAGLHDRHFQWQHYGGALALLRLSRFVRTEILHDAEPPPLVIPIPQNVFIQRGDLFLKKVGEVVRLPSGWPDPIEGQRKRD